MPERGDAGKGLVATVGRWLMVCLDVFLLVAIFLCMGGSMGVLYTLNASDNVSSIDQAFILILGGFGTVVSLALLLAWGVSFRLTIITRQLHRMRKDLDRLTEQTKQRG